MPRFTHTRLPVSSDLLIDESNTANPLRQTHLRLIDTVVERIIAAGLPLVFGLVLPLVFAVSPA